MAVYSVTRHLIAGSEAALGPGPWPVDDLLPLGWTHKRLQSAVQRGALRRVRRGVYLPVSLLATADPGGSVEQVEPITTQWIRSTLRRVDPGAVVSHDSAALLHRTWLPGRPKGLVHVTVPGQAERWSAGLRVHASRLPDEFVTTIDGIRVTTLARTGVDLARGRSFPLALVAIDGAYRRLILRERPRADRQLRERAVPAAVLMRARDELEAAFAITWSWPGTRAVRQALDHADPASESAFESWSRGLILLSSLPRPETAGSVTGASGQGCFGDFVWRAQRVIGEADGLGKYGATEAEVRERLRAERVRQADLEAAGWRFVRWTTGESGRHVLVRLARSLYLT